MTDKRSAEGAGDEGSTPSEGRLKMSLKFLKSLLTPVDLCSAKMHVVLIFQLLSWLYILICDTEENIDLVLVLYDFMVLFNRCRLGYIHRPHICHFFSTQIFLDTNLEQKRHKFR